MTVQQPRYSKQEYARRGGVIYQQQVRPQVEAGNKGKIVAIDIETAEYAVGDDILSASQPLIDKNADAQIWVLRIGHRSVHRIGEKMSALMTSDYLAQRAGRGNRAKFEQALSKVPAAPPDPNDALE